MKQFKIRCKKKKHLEVSGHLFDMMGYRGVLELFPRIRENDIYSFPKSDLCLTLKTNP